MCIRDSDSTVRDGLGEVVDRERARVTDESRKDERADLVYESLAQQQAAQPAAGVDAYRFHAEALAELGERAAVIDVIGARDDGLDAQLGQLRQVARWCRARAEHHRAAPVRKAEQVAPRPHAPATVRHDQQRCRTAGLWQLARVRGGGFLCGGGEHRARAAERGILLPGGRCLLYTSDAADDLTRVSVEADGGVDDHTG